MRIIKTKVYTIDEHPNKNLCFDYIRKNWHDLNQHSVYELIDSIKALHEKIGGDVNYSISQFPCRGEYIWFRNYDNDILKSLDAESESLTGTFWDCNLINGLREGNVKSVLHNLHDETYFVYSNEGLNDLCMANKYEFNEDGKPILYDQYKGIV
jgi:hypothetical protein